MKKTYIAPTSRETLYGVEQIIAGSITNIGGDSGIGLGEDDVPESADAPGNPFGGSVFE